MTMDERLEKKDMGRLKIEWDEKRKSAVQSFRRVLIIINTRLEAVHSTWKTWLRAEKKFSVLHKNISIRRKHRV